MKDWTGNKKTIYTTLGASNHTEKEREENDFYATDPIAIDKLLQIEQPQKNVFECCAGNGHLAERLKAFGYTVITNDLIQREYELDWHYNFLEMHEIPKGFDVITNPPYKYAKEFVLKALELVSDDAKVYMFLKLQFLEGKARYQELFIKYPPKKIYVFSERIACAKNGDFNAMKEMGGSAVAYAWFVWEKGFNGKTIIEWI